MRKFTFLILTIFAAWLSAGAATYKAYFNNSENWSEVAAYAYCSDGTKLFNDWPGKKLTETTTFNGKTYYVATIDTTVSADQITIIFNNNKKDGASQTTNLKLVDGHHYDATGDLDVEKTPLTIYYDNSETNWNTLYVYFYGAVNSSAWHGELMTNVEGTNYYSYTFSDTPNGGITLIFNNNSSGDSNQTEDYNTNLVANGIYKGEKNGSSKCTVSYSGIYSSGGGNTGTTYPSSVYMIGHVNGCGFNPDKGVSATGKNGVYTYNVTINNADNGFGYFGFSKEIGNWDTVNAGRYGANSKDEVIASGQTADVKNSGNSWKILAGNYTVTLDLSTMKVSVEGSSSGEGDNPGGSIDIGGTLGKSLKPTGTLPVMYINVYTDASLSELNDEIIDINLRHKDYLSYANYWLVDNQNPENNLGSEDSPLPLEIKARGNYTRTGFAKKPFKLKLGSKADLLGLTPTKSKHYALIAHADDDLGFLRNFTGFWLGRKIGLAWTPNQTPVEVVINGDYRGLYFLTESIRVEKGRLNITELGDEADQPNDLTGGYLVEFDNYSSDPNTIAIDPGNSIYITPDTPEKYSGTQKRFVTEQFTKMNSLVNAHNSQIWNYLDLDDAVRYYIIEEFVGHIESYHGSTYMFRDKASATDAGKWHYAPLWDFGHAFEANGGIIEGALFEGQVAWLPGLRETDGFKTKAKATWQWYMSNNLLNEVIDAINAHSAKIASAAVQDHKRWPSTIIPATYYIEENNNSNNPTPVVDNSNINAQTTKVINYLRNRASYLSGWDYLGDYSANPNEPTRDNRPSASLDEYDYIKPKDNQKAYNYTFYFVGDYKEVRVWTWDNNCPDGYDCKNNIWADRPYMTKKQNALGEDYFEYSFTVYEKDLVSPKVLFTWGDSDNQKTSDFTLVNGKVYNQSGGSASVDPNAPVADHTIPCNKLTIFVKNTAGWGNINVWMHNEENGDFSSNFPGFNLPTSANSNVNNTESVTTGYLSKIVKLNDTQIEGLSYFEVPEGWEYGLIIFSNNKNNQYPSQESNSSLAINGVSHVFDNYTKAWTPIYPYSGTLPIVSITTQDGAEVGGSNVKMNFEIYSVSDESYERLVSPGDMKDKIKLRGTSSYNPDGSVVDQPSYKVSLDKKAAWCGMEKSKHFVLMPWVSTKNNYALLNNIVGHRLSELFEMKWTPSFAPVELMVNGEYKGLYFVVENVRPSENRVAIPDFGDTGIPCFDEIVRDYNVEEDWIIEVDNSLGQAADYTWSENGKNFYIEATNPESANWADPKEMNMNKDVVQGYFNKQVDALRAAFDSATLTDKNGFYYSDWENVIDRDEAVKYYIIQEIMDDKNAFNKSLFLYHTSDAKWMFGPVWDFSEAFASSNDNFKKGDLIHSREDNTVTFIDKLYDNAYFKNVVVREYWKRAHDCDVKISSSDDFKNEQNPQKTKFYADILDSSIVSGNKGNQDFYNALCEEIDNTYDSYKEALKKDIVAYAADPTTSITDMDTAKENVKAALSLNIEYLDKEWDPETEGVTTAVSPVFLDPESAEAPVEYYDTLGRRIANPSASGVYIRKQGSIVSKLVIR